MRLVPDIDDPLVALLAQICAELEASVARRDPAGFADVLARARRIDPSITTLAAVREATRRARGLVLVTPSTSGSEV